MKEFFRRNKLIIQFLIGVAALLGMDEGKTVFTALKQIYDSIKLSTSLLSWDWWSSPVWEVPFARILFALLFLAVFANALFTYRYRDKPISILSTELTMRFENGGSRVRTSRRQVMRANRPGIAASFFNVSLTAPGASFGNFDAHIRHPTSLKLDLKLSGNGVKKEIDVCYREELPYSWIVSLIPRWILNWAPENLPPFIAQYLVIQILNYESLREYNQIQTFSLTSTRYQHLRVRIVLDFSNDSGPKPKNADDIQVVRRLSNAVIDDKAMSTGHENVYVVELGPGLKREETIMLSWKNI